MKRSHLKARLYIWGTTALGAGLLLLALSDWQTHDLPRFVCYLLIAVLASGLKVKLPGVTGTMSVNFLFILIGILELSLSETLLLGCSAGLLQCFWKARRRPTRDQLFFNVSNLAIAISASYFVYHRLLGAQLIGGLPLMLVLAASTYFLANTIPVTLVICLTEGKCFKKVWNECYFWSFPFYLVGASIAGLFNTFNRFVGWQVTLLVLPVMFWIYRSYRLYLERLQSEKTHAEEMAALHLRTIEALALAIDAKDHTTHEHLRRVRVYAMEIGKDLNLGDSELEALRAAAMLHDIGKLAVPEHIISKPGRLSPEEFEKMKIHPIVGAEILERVQFPYPVVPIVRSHHEKWDGTGYPEGLQGQQIPIGARILAAVDCLDALASDRQYRRAMPLDKAMQKVAEEAGTWFDPSVIEVLVRRYVELEQMAQVQPAKSQQLSMDVRVERGEAPAAGFETAKPSASTEPERLRFLSSIAAARQEVQTLHELTTDLGTSLSSNETLSFLDARLKQVIPYDSIAIYVQRDSKLVPEYVNGDDFLLLSALEIPIGQGVSGWVAEEAKPVLNGNPSVELPYPSDASRFTLRSALAVPLEGPNGMVGVLSLYHKERDAFSRDHLRILQAIAYKVAMSIENALKYRQVEKSATTDGLTGLPNTKSLFLHLDSELARCKRDGSPLTVLVCDLDGFKQVNDRFGHLEGNRVLQLVAKGLRENCRAYDYVARMGGDEFVVVLPGEKPETLRGKLPRLAEMVADVGRQVCGQDSLALSVGEAYFPMDGGDAEQLLSEADRRMYQAKNHHKTVLRGRAIEFQAPALMVQ